jgi:hypothetical protein
MRFSSLVAFLAAALLASCQTESNHSKSEPPVVTAVVTENAHEPLAEPASSNVSDTVLTPAADSLALHKLSPATVDLSRLDTTRATGFYDAFGRYLAGLPARPNAPITDTLLTSARWSAFRKANSAKWRAYERSRVQPIRRWAIKELDSAAQPLKTVFYPFSGPDLLNVHTYFPQAETYVMVGLEPVGSLPTPAVLTQPNLFKMVQSSLWSVLSFSFFRTNSMAQDFKTAELDGTLPVLLLFATRTGHRVIDAQLVHLSADGELQEGAAAANTLQVPGSRLLLTDSTGRGQTVYYFSADISDGKLAANPALIAFAKKLGSVATFVKSASYLMHKSYFSKVRNVVLNQSQLLLQDDSGIAYDFFDDGRWRILHYGHYTKPISLFAAHYQHDLFTAYRDSVHRPKNLPFGTGYNHRANESNLMLALRKTRS